MSEQESIQLNEQLNQIPLPLSPEEDSGVQKGQTDENGLYLVPKNEGDKLLVDLSSQLAQNPQPDSLPIINPENGLFEDESGQWGGNKYFGEADIQFLNKRRDRIRTIGGLGVNRNKTTLFHLEDAQKVLQERNKDISADENGVYADGSEQWGNRKYFGFKDYAYLESMRTRSLPGIGGGRKPTTFFNINEAHRILQERNNLPQVGSETGIFEDESGRWGTKKYFGKSDSAYLKDQGSRVRTKRGRAANGNIATLFNIEDGQRALQERDSLPQIDPSTGIVEDESGQWGGRKFFDPNEIEYLKLRKDMIRKKQGRTNGVVTTLFNLEDARKALEERDSLPQVQAETGIFEDESGRWGTKKYFGPVDTNFLRNRKRIIRTKEGRASNGDFATLYNIEDAKWILEERDNIQSNNISPDRADEMMMGLQVE